MATALCISSMLLILVASSTATFQTIKNLAPLDGIPGIWRGNPAVSIHQDQSNTSLTCRICADAIHWSAEVADAICQNYGFEGVMIIEENAPVDGSELDGYVVCKTVEIVDIYSKPLSCELTDVCDSVPTISCLLPGYRGCYANTEPSPFFPGGETATINGTNIQTCATACSDFPYLGLTDGQVCVCGSELGIGDEGVCDEPCEADDLQACGADFAISTYEANVIGECIPERVDLTLNQPHYITSPNFPDRYVPGESCTWVMGIDVAQSYNLEVIVTFDFNEETTDNLWIYTEPSGEVAQFIPWGKGTSRHSFHPISAAESTLKVQFTPPAEGTSHPGAGFSIKLRVTDDQTRPTDNPNITDAPMTTSKAGQCLHTKKLAISAVVGVVLFVAFLA